MFIYRDALPTDGGGGVVEGTVAAEPQKTGNAFKDAASDYLKNNPITNDEKAEGTEGDPVVEIEKEVEEKKEPEFDPLAEESKPSETDEITEVGIMNEKGEFEKKPFDKVLEDAVFTLKHDKKVVQVEGYEKLKNLAQMGLNSTKINTEAKRVIAENQQLKAGWQKAVETKAIEIANSMYLAAMQDQADPAAEGNEGANSKMYRLLQKQIEDMKTERQKEVQEREQQRQFQDQQRNRQMASEKAKEIGETIVNPFKQHFKDAGQKFDEPAFNRFQRDVKLETRDELERIASEQGRDPVFEPEEIQEVMKRVAVKVYKDMDSLVERRYKAKIALKKTKGSSAPAISTGGAGMETPAKSTAGKKVTFKDIKAGLYS